MSNITIVSSIALDQSQMASALPSLIETLIVAKISALAIIFSATFIVSQLVNRRYSAEFTNYFVESNLFRVSLVALVLIIIGDIILMIVISGLSPNYTVLAIGVSIVLLSIFMAIIYHFVSEMLLKTTPAELLKSFSNSLTTQSYIDQCISARKNNSKNLHPLQPIYDTARNSIQNGELAVAEVAENRMRGICIDVAESNLLEKYDIPIYRTDTDYDHTDKFEKVHLLFKIPFNHYFSSLSQIAANRNYDSLTRNSVLSISKIGQSGLDSVYHELVNTAFGSIYNQNITNIPEDIDRSSTQYTRLEAGVRGTMELLKSTISKGNLELYCYLNTLGYEIVRTTDAKVEKSGFDEEHPHFTILEFQKECYELLIKQYRRFYETSDLDLNDILGNTDTRLSITRDYSGYENQDPRISALITCRTLMFATTSQYLSNTDWLNDETVVSHKINQRWKDWIIFSSNNPPRADGVLIAQRYIEMIVHHAVEEKEGMLKHSLMDIVRLMDEGDLTVIEDAFEQIYNWEKRDYDLYDYSSYRGLGRFFVWRGLPWNEYSEEFIELTKELHLQAKAQHYKRLKNQTYRAAHNYQNRMNRGDNLPDPVDYITKNQKEQKVEIGPTISTYTADSD